MKDKTRRRFLSGLMGKKSDEKTSASAKPPPDACAAIVKDPMESVSEHDGAEAIAAQWKEAETDDDRLKMIGTYGIGAIALALVAIPGEANAFSASGLARETVRQLEPVLREIMETFSGGLFSVISQAGDGTATAVGISGDAMVSAITNSHNEQIRLASRPDTNRCVNDASSETNNSVSRNAARQKSALTDQGVKELMGADQPLRKLVREAEVREQTYGETSADLNASLLVKPSGYTAEEDAAAAALRNRLRSSAVMGAAGAAGAAAAGEMTPTDRLNQLSKAEYVAKCSVSDYVISSCIADRQRDKRARAIIDRAVSEDTDQTAHVQRWLSDNDPRSEGLSARDLMQFEVDRRYGNPDWHAVLRTDMVNPVPLLRELVLMEAVGLKVQMKQLELLEQQSVVAALQLSELLKNEAEVLANIRRGQN